MKRLSQRPRSTQARSVRGTVAPVSDSLNSLPLNTDGTDPATPPRLPIWSMWTGSDGLSHIDASELAGFGLKSIGGGADPQWLRPFPGTVTNVSFAVLPVGWVGDWHESPAPQWVVPLRGRWFIETQDGSRVEMGPGEIHFGQDQATSERDGHTGHRSGQLGDEPCLQLLVQFAPPVAASTQHPFA